MHGKNRKDIRPGLRVHITQKQDQRSGRLINGVVQDILTTSAFHSRGIKVRLQTGEVGRVQEIIETNHRPTVSPLIIPLLYCHINGFQRAFSVEKPWPGGEKRMAGGQRIPWHDEAIGSFLLPCAPPGCPRSREGA
jgi:uncharacterized repeat protein (TIGR03833 family)